MNRRYAVKGKVTGNLVTQGGLIITHTSREEMEFLFPKSRVVPCDAPPEECLPLRFARGVEHIRFPIQRKDFKDGS